MFNAAKKRADKLCAKGKEIDFHELLKMEPDRGTRNVRRRTAGIGRADGPLTDLDDDEASEAVQLLEAGEIEPARKQ
ncbi:hypothetical protein [Nitratireductor luteus]|uniref:hypothetical protein n=1 Tax=Nitratireductor luteus TaxID=2976980 RepID=UPI002240D118|nr:hypothetical protein [Nitratireductor luteus]